jgi:signal transduction histidine kinase
LDRAPESRSRIVFPPLLLSILLFGLLAYASTRIHAMADAFDREVRQYTFDQGFRSWRVGLEERLGRDEEALRGVAALYAASFRVSREEFRAYYEAADLIGDHLLGVGFASFVDPADRRSWERDIRQAGFEGVRIRTEGNDPAYVADFLEPYDRLAPMHGLDLFTTEAAREAVRRSYLENGFRMTPVVDLTAVGLEGQGFLAFHPVLRRDDPDAPPQGFAMAVYDLNRLLASVSGDHPVPSGVRVQLRDAGAASRPLLYVAGSEVADPAFAKAYDVRLGDRSWRLTWEADASFGRRRGWMPVTVLLLGLITSALLSLFVHGLLVRHSAVRREVRAKDRQLARSHEEIDRTMDALRAANEQLQATDKAKTEFLSNVSHELRTPLTVIREYVDLILSGKAGKVDEDAKEFLGITREQLRRLHRLVNDLLDFARLENDTLLVRPRFSDPSALLSRLREFYQPVAEKKEQTLQFSVEGELPHFWIDPDRLEQILGNLISNALKFTPRGGGVRVFASFEGKDVAFLVEDEGPGIPEEHLPHLFDRYYQAEGASRPAEGVGLGLSIALGLTRLQGGEIDLQSAEGQGTIFLIRFPARTLEQVVQQEMESLHLSLEPGMSLSGFRASIPGGQAGQLEDWIHTHLAHDGKTRVIGEPTGDAVLVIADRRGTLDDLAGRSRAVFPLVRWEPVDLSVYFGIEKYAA